MGYPGQVWISNCMRILGVEVDVGVGQTHEQGLLENPSCELAEANTKENS